MKTLIEFINEKQHDFPFATGELTRLLHDIGIAAKIVHREINMAGLTKNMGFEGGENVQGERQKKLDVFANETFINTMRASGICCGIASEENEKSIIELLWGDIQLGKRIQACIIMWISVHILKRQ